MALAHSSSIATDGLVFYYDAANTKKSWKGRPVTNIFVLPTVDVNGFNVQNNTFTRVRSGNYGGYEITGNDYVWRFDFTSSVTCPYHGNDTTVGVGVTYTFSFDYYVSPDAPAGGYGTRNLQLANFEQAISASVSDTTPTVVGVWKRAVFTGTTSSTNLRALLYPGSCNVAGGMSSSGYILLKNPQVEASAPGNNPSPFVDGTRSNTQSILDLTGNNTITANSLTYASDGTFSFNGSDNLITFPENSALNTQTPTVEVWVKTNATTQNGFWFEKGTVNSQYALFQEGGTIQWRLGPLGDLTTTTATYMNTSNWYQVVGTYTSGDRRLYINGTLVNSNTTTGTLSTNTSGCSIGAYGGFNGSRGYYYNGNIAIVKVYDRVLPASEVQKNFNALRGRFGV